MLTVSGTYGIWIIHDILKIEQCKGYKIKRKKFLKRKKFPLTHLPLIILTEGVENKILVS